MKTLLLFLLITSSSPQVPSATSNDYAASAPGTYLRQGRPTDYIELSPDGNFFFQQSGKKVAGTFRVSGDTVTIVLPTGRADRAKFINKDTVLDSDGIYWVRQSAPVAAQGVPGDQPRFGLQNVTLVAKLLSPISTATSNESDQFTAVVDQPSQYQGAVLTGRITKLKKPKKGIKNPKAEISFEFQSMTLNGKTAPIEADLKELVNSKGVKGVDEEGQVIGTSSNKKKIGSALAGAGAGALIGALAGGAKGAAAGAALGAGIGLAIGLTMTTSGEQIELQPGSMLTLDTSDRARTGKRLN